jgi:hypothetical protein
MRVLILSCLAVLSAACTTVPSNAPAYAPAPSATPGASNVYIYRLNAPPLMHNPTIVVDGVAVIDPPEKSYTVIQLPPGAHEVQVNWSWLAGWPSLKFSIDVAPAEPYYLKVSGSSAFSNGGLNMESNAGHIELAAAEAELAQCCRYIPPRKAKK